MRRLTDLLNNIKNKRNGYICVYRGTILIDDENASVDCKKKAAVKGKKILKRQTILAESVSPKVVVHSTLITTFGLIKNEYSGVFSNVIVLDDLFKEE